MSFILPKLKYGMRLPGPNQKIFNHVSVPLSILIKKAITVYLFKREVALDISFPILFIYKDICVSITTF